MPKPKPAPQRPYPRAAAEPGAPVSDADRLVRGLPLESGEPQPSPVPRRIH